MYCLRSASDALPSQGELNLLTYWFDVAGDFTGNKDVKIPDWSIGDSGNPKLESSTLDFISSDASDSVTVSFLGLILSRKLDCNLHGIVFPPDD